MRRIQLLFALLATMTVVHGQRDTVRKYLDAGLHFTNKRNMVFAALAIRTGDHWLLLAVYPDTSMLARIYFKNEGLTIKDGPYTIYSQGNKIQDGNFIDNIAEGNWQSWHVNGLPQDSGQVKHNYFIGQWKHWHKNGQLKVLNKYSGAAPKSTEAIPDESKGGLISDIHIDGVLNGPWQSWYANGVLESSGVYSNDSMSGTWKWFREDGTPSSVETYANGKITQLECYD
ncbi:MAG TPA: hypothetical protein VLD19_17920, partial [Chitinophagaceae bacterium]|nr:hypothetical protein [Chitinophagaceae bacterium]